MVVAVGNSRLQHRRPIQPGRPGSVCPARSVRRTAYRWQAALAGLPKISARPAEVRCCRMVLCPPVAVPVYLLVAGLPSLARRPALMNRIAYGLAHGLVRGIDANWSVLVLIGGLCLAIAVIELFTWFSRRQVEIRAPSSAPKHAGRSGTDSRTAAQLAVPGVPGLAELGVTDDATFELWALRLFQDLGYETQQAGLFYGDYGANLVAAKTGTRTAVRTVYGDQAVELDAVQQVVASLRHYRCAQGIVVANNLFTSRAVYLAQTNRVPLWGCARLVQILGVLRQGGQPAPSWLTGPVLYTDIAPGSCVQCGVPVPDGERDWCLRRPEVYGGHVYCRLHWQAVATPWVIPGQPG